MLSGIAVSALVAGSIALGGCVQFSDRTQVQARALYASTTCAGAESGQKQARWIAEPAAFEPLLEQFAELGRQGAPPPEVAFGEEVVLFLAAGQRPSAGYRLVLGSSQVEVEQGAARVVVHWEEPRPGSVQAQVITCPWLLIGLPRAGYDRIEIVDAAQRVRLTLTPE